MDVELNSAQCEAVGTLSGPLLVLAGAGTGKTRVVTYRVANLIRHGVRPGRILAVTFTNKAAREMRVRALQLLGARRGRLERPEISTFHSLCVRILRRHATQLGYPSTFAIYDQRDQEGVARDVMREIRFPLRSLSPGDLVQRISRWKSACVHHAEAAELATTDEEHLASIAYRRYEKALKARGAVDFDDMLLLTDELFHRFPAACQEEAHRFDHLLIDEYQDTSASQYRIAKALATRHRNLCVVGDDDQAIYAWRGARVDHILEFTRDWPDARLVRLEDNYRCTGAILELANRLIGHNKRRHRKVLRAAQSIGERPRILQFKDSQREARGIVNDIQQQLENPGSQPRDFAILLRTNEQTRPFETELRRARVPYVVVGGISFYDRKEVRDVLAYLRLLIHPQSS
jgi:DNA helicase-2/ATP-dependent DNA helicase PcrA